ncbi:Clp protease N-terminal domain-containing protein [Dactylosporangium sp. NPDC051485]|uniref:Clp protease N-terminal domain-containing protein n=1 Tax=Dactylosporangium sp. NPDC051485 TaxID=3154846 RepID=UPI003447BBD0
MPKINVYLPDELAEAVREAGVPVSAICQRALEQAVRRVTAMRETVLGDLDDATLAARLPGFTARARTVLRLAAERAAPASTVGTGHLLAGLVDEGSNLALHVLRALEIDPAAIPAAGPDPDGTTAAGALELAVTEAAALGHNYVGCEHLLLGLVADPDGAAGQVLRSLGAEMRLTRRAVAAALAGYVHLQANTQGQAQGPAMAALLERIERLERRLDERA